MSSSALLRLEALRKCHIRKVGGKPVGGFAWLMRLQNRKQVPVCRECHRKIHRGEYDGLRLADLAYRVGP
jgi:hypothetical protein